MKALRKIIGIFLTSAILIVPSVAEAKTKKTGKKHTKSVSYKKSHNISKHSKHSKLDLKVRKVSYSYGPRVYGDDLEPNKDIYKYAIGLLGTKYSFGGNSIDGIDCSSFVQHVFELAGYKMPRTAREQALYGYFVRRENLKPGDLLFFATYASYPSHVGIYIGNGKMIHASSRGRRVEVADINQDYYIRRFLFAKRIPANMKELITQDSMESIQEYISENSKKEDPIAKIIKEKDGKN
ncbi:C40 family peptidase [Sulfurihydrogenibium subterraneum]|uniref:C40 family peptidase n=1 Tax=Sulfurihydrogenibium subterraneum TaxID=171121 RepID=UPI00048D5DE1|nr:C40 family peptidase [Sulfurihydrogenibium subterraneum]